MTQISAAETTAAINSILRYLDESLYSDRPIDLETYHKIECMNETPSIPIEHNEQCRLDSNTWICLRVNADGVVCNKIIKGKSLTNVIKHTKTHLKSPDRSEKSRLRSLKYYRIKKLKRQLESDTTTICDQLLRNNKETTNSSKLTRKEKKKAYMAKYHKARKQREVENIRAAKKRETQCIYQARYRSKKKLEDKKKADDCFRAHFI